MSFLKQQTTEAIHNVDSFNIKDISQFLNSPYELIYCTACDYLKQDDQKSGNFSLSLDGAAKYTVLKIFEQMDT